MYNIIANGENIANNIKEFACDSSEDLTALPECAMGSTAFIISTSEVYMMNGNREWVKL